jgi:ATP-dependent Clp protease ATP-binding subunit ClpA
MFQRFTDRARRVVHLAQEEARRLNHNYIGTEHILLGLIHEGEGVAAKALESLGISLEAVRAQVEEIIGQGQTAPAGPIPFTPRAKKVLELSLREAQLGHNYIGTEHILLGLLREGEGVAAQVLVKLGADLSRVRERVLLLLTGEGEQAGATTRLVRLAVPAELLDYDARIAEVRRRKEAAIDARDLDTAVALRDQEKQLLADKLRREREWTAGVDVQAVIEENQRVHRELERLRALLRDHDIEPNGGTARTA